LGAAQAAIGCTNRIGKGTVSAKRLRKAANIGDFGFRRTWQGRSESRMPARAPVTKLRCASRKTQSKDWASGD
jgi:hypothetical protein